MRAGTAGRGRRKVPLRRHTHRNKGLAGDRTGSDKWRGRSVWAWGCPPSSWSFCGKRSKGSVQELTEITSLDPKFFGLRRISATAEYNILSLPTWKIKYLSPFPHYDLVIPLLSWIRNTEFRFLNLWGRREKEGWACLTRMPRFSSSAPQQQRGARFI